MKKKMVGSENSRLSSGRKIQSSGMEYSTYFGPSLDRIGYFLSRLAGSKKTREEKESRDLFTISLSTSLEVTEKQLSQLCLLKYQQLGSHPMMLKMMMISLLLRRMRKLQT